MMPCVMRAWFVTLVPAKRKLAFARRLHAGGHDRGGIARRGILQLADRQRGRLAGDVDAVE